MKQLGGILSPNFAFSAGGSLALLSWVVLSASLFASPQIRSIIWIATDIVIPMIFGVAYVALLVRGFRDSTGGGSDRSPLFAGSSPVTRLIAAGWTGLY